MTEREVNRDQIDGGERKYNGVVQQGTANPKASLMPGITQNGFKEVFKGSP